MDVTIPCDQRLSLVSSTTRLVLRSCSVIPLGVVLFGAAGRYDLPWFWTLLLLHLGLCLGAGRDLDPGLMRERMFPGPGGRDRALRASLVPFLLAQWIITGLDMGRYGWTGPAPQIAHLAGIVAYILGMSLLLSAMVANRFFSPVVRIQNERGHRLISQGPYRFVRHPGYAGMLLAFPGCSLALGSWWSLIPLIPVAALIVRRLLLEDRYLRYHLEGYTSYAGRVRYRLVPGMW